jgi:MFS family permease
MAEIASTAAPANRAPAAPLPAAAGAWPATRVAYYTAFVLILSTTFAQLDIAIVPYLAGNIKKDLHITDTELSLLVGASFGLFYTVVGVPIAWFLDRFSRKWILAVAITVWSLGTALCGIAQNYTQLFVSRFLVGAGEAVNGPAAYSIVSDLFPREKMPRGVAVLQIGSVAGPAVSTLISFFVLKAFLDIKPIPVAFGVIHGWQLIFVLVGLPGVLVSLLMATTMREPKRHIIPAQVSTSSTNAGYWQTLVYLFRHWKVFAPMFGSLFVGSLVQGSIAWQPIFFKRTFNWGPAQLAGLNIVPALVLMPIGLVLGTMIAEHFQRKGKVDAALRTDITASLVALPGVFAALMPNPWLAWILFSLTMFSIGLGGPSKNAAFQIVTPTELRGKMTALYLFIYSVVGVAFAPVVTALITDFILHDESKIAWAIFIPAVFARPISLFITWLGLGPYRREVERLNALEARAA